MIRNRPIQQEIVGITKLEVDARGGARSMRLSRNQRQMHAEEPQKGSEKASQSSLHAEERDRWICPSAVGFAWQRRICTGTVKLLPLCTPEGQFEREEKIFSGVRGSHTSVAKKRMWLTHFCCSSACGSRTLETVSWVGGQAGGEGTTLFKMVVRLDLDRWVLIQPIILF